MRVFHGLVVCMWAALVVATLPPFALAATPAVEPGGKTLRGIVVAINSQAGMLVVRHEPFGGMPVMTMPFAVSPRDVKRLHANERISGVVVATGSAFGLRDIRTFGTAPPRRVLSWSALPLGSDLPELPLVDQDGRPFSFRSLGRTAIVSFVCTRCPDAATSRLVASKFALLQQRIDPVTMRLVTVALDADVDTPAALRRYDQTSGRRDDRWTLVTGSPAAVDQIVGNLGAEASARSSGAIVHVAALDLVDPNGIVVERVEGNAWTADDALLRARTAVNESASPGARLAEYVPAIERIAIAALVLAVTAFAVTRALRPARRS